MNRAKRLALAFDEACRAAGVDYALIGGVAVMAWGQPRATMDVDALLHAAKDRFAVLQEEAAKRGITLRAEDLVAATRDQSHVSAFQADSPFHLDIKLARSEGELLQIRDARQVHFGAASIRVVGPESTIAYKLRFGSPQDVQDARSILARQGPRIDPSKLEEICHGLGVLPALQDLMRQVRDTETTDS